MTWPIRILVRRLRLELMLAVGAVFLVSAAGLVLARELTEAHGTAAEFDWLQWAPYLQVALVCLPVVAGLAFAASLIAGEIDSGTSVFAWSVVRSRRRWLADLVAAGLLAVVVTTVPLVLVSLILDGSLGPILDAASAPAGIDTAAVLIPARAIAAFAVGVLLALTVGRSLQALVAGLIAACLVLGAVELGFAAWRGAAAGPIDLTQPGVFPVSQAAAEGPPAESQSPTVGVGLSPDTRLLLLLGQSGILTVTAAGAVLAATLVVERRLPG
jgi:hypothetical protein